MRTILILCIFLLVAVPGAVGQESSGAKVGIGVGIEPIRLIPVSNTFVSLAVTPVAISVPIEISSGTRIEPEVGIFYFSTESGGTTRTTSMYRLGVGVFFPVAKSENTVVYVGPRVGLFLSSSKTESGSTSESSETDFFIAANAGGEYAVSDAFRVFGEAQFYYLNYGKPTYTPAPPISSDRSQSVVSTNIVMGMRFYF